MFLGNRLGNTETHGFMRFVAVVAVVASLFYITTKKYISIYIGGNRERLGNGNICNTDTDWSIIRMTKEQGNCLEALYQNCLTHAVKHGASEDFWERTTAAFYKLTDDAHNQALTEQAVEKYMELQRRFA